MANEAFDKFKHDMTAENFCAAVAEAIAGEPAEEVGAEAVAGEGAADEPAAEEFAGSEI